MKHGTYVALGGINLTPFCKSLKRRKKQKSFISYWMFWQKQVRLFLINWRQALRADNQTEAQPPALCIFVFRELCNFPNDVQPSLTAELKNCCFICQSERSRLSYNVMYTKTLNLSKQKYYMLGEIPHKLADNIYSTRYFTHDR